MALSRNKTEEIPKDAVVLSEDQALAYQWKIVSGWEKPGEVWSLKYTPGVLATFAAITGVYVNNHYRTKLRLGASGKLSTYLPIVVIPAMFSMLSHKMFVQREILLESLQLNSCPLCLQMRAATFQAGLGVIYPTLLAPFAAFMFATRHYTYRLPSITQEPLEVLKLWRKMTKPIVPVLGAFLAGQSLITMYLTYKEQEQNFQIQMEMRKLEQRLEQEHDNDLSKHSDIF